MIVADQFFLPLAISLKIPTNLAIGYIVNNIQYFQISLYPNDIFLGQLTTYKILEGYR